VGIYIALNITMSCDQCVNRLYMGLYLIQPLSDGSQMHVY